jgi:hypothetical protein
MWDTVNSLKSAASWRVPSSEKLSMGPSARARNFALGCVTLIIAPRAAEACLLANPAEYLGAAVAMSVWFWFASFGLGVLIFFLDAYERRVSLVLPVVGWVVFLWGVIVYRNAMVGTTGYDVDCSVPLLTYSHYVLGVISAMFAYRVFCSARSR